ncbi:hypothetical protein BGZ61DRAFT_453979 [Ilyonectria robusta]|uniref:uncharacterized protein n=1 Tax=Ilyonectria robusta TaxID=1079257 RepID=UPI001E8D0353|nr:uncharacterized protein BGZ61DRAFT_453979 [Ilyonectria robusta]KAH8686969.1 hypothetical protein BGZ61DRAFT_453979 [Ilyonectria robusta]
MSWAIFLPLPPLTAAIHQLVGSIHCWPLRPNRPGAATTCVRAPGAGQPTTLCVLGLFIFKLDPWIHSVGLNRVLSYSSSSSCLPRI